MSSLTRLLFVSMDENRDTETAFLMKGITWEEIL